MVGRKNYLLSISNTWNERFVYSIDVNENKWWYCFIFNSIHVYRMYFMISKFWSEYFIILYVIFNIQLNAKYSVFPDFTLQFYVWYEWFISYTLCLNHYKMIAIRDAHTKIFSWGWPSKKPNLSIVKSFFFCAKKYPYCYLLV